MDLLYNRLCDFAVLSVYVPYCVHAVFEFADTKRTLNRAPAVHI